MPIFGGHTLGQSRSEHRQGAVADFVKGIFLAACEKLNRMVCYNVDKATVVNVHYELCSSLLVLDKGSTTMQ